MVVKCVFATPQTWSQLCIVRRISYLGQASTDNVPESTRFVDQLRPEATVSTGTLERRQVHPAIGHLEVVRMMVRKEGKGFNTAATGAAHNSRTQQKKSQFAQIPARVLRDAPVSAQSCAARSQKPGTHLGLSIFKVSSAVTDLSI
ncbi:hypothetical protein AC579_4984 [Pseudocercospora musae]|uniref:Uncharacterized protein n=1 Tax=Pseudocercospora musae TaxID=113226 RepID=A0A139IGH5_9PEZI|nr:hypothetical protein AC579_4984 [Pseudocercospora musae]